MLIISRSGSWLHGPGQDFVLLCLYPGGNAAICGMAVEPTGVREDTWLPVIVGRVTEASSPGEGKPNMLGASA